MYVIGIIFWIVLIVILRLYKQPSLLGVLILAIPFVILAIGVVNAASNTVLSIELIGSSYLPFGLLIIAPLLAWTAKDYNGDKKQFVTIIITAFILLLLSIIDIWVREWWVPYIAHIRSILETMALALLIYALYLYMRSYQLNGV